MIHFITGKPGGGKSLMAMRAVIHELTRTNRDVVTNLPIRLDVLNEYLQRNYPDRIIPIFGPDSRLVLLDSNEASKRLYRDYKAAYYRARPQEREAVYEEFEKKLLILGVTEETRTFWKFRNPRKLRFEESVGTLFVLDEVHLHFNARKWAENGTAAVEYLSQHRHFSDDVILVTQHADNVDAQFRRLVEDWSVVKNGYRQRLGWFRALPRFSVAVYAFQPSGTKQAPFETKSFTLDAKGVAACYNTAAASGAAGNGADTKKKLVGLHPAWFVVMVVAGALLLGGIIKGANVLAMNKLMPPDKVAKLEGRVDQVTTSLPQPVKAERKVYLDENGKTAVLVVNGYIRVGNRINVVLSDGRVLDERSPELDMVKRNYAVISGEVVYMRRPADRQTARQVDSSSDGRSVDQLPQADNQNQVQPRADDVSGAWHPPDSGGVVRLKPSNDTMTSFSGFAGAGVQPQIGRRP